MSIKRHIGQLVPPLSTIYSVLQGPDPKSVIAIKRFQLTAVSCGLALGKEGIYSKISKEWCLKTYNIYSHRQEGSWNHRIIWVGRDLWRYVAQPPAQSRANFNARTGCSGPYPLEFLKSMTSLKPPGSLFQCPTTLAVKPT